MFAPLLGTYSPCQVAVICRDVEAAKRQYAEFLGLPIPPTGDGGVYEVTGMEYKGKPCPTQGAKLAFFELGNIQLELIEPYGGPSVWQDFLDETGGGIHHIAYHVDDMETAIEKCKAFGMELVQYGKYGDASGAYAYFDASAQLGCCIELLCDFGKKE